MTTTSADSPVPARQPLRVLILEDNPQDAELMAATLRRAGYSLSLEVTDSRQQFQQQLKQADYDVILADYNLGSWTAMDALELLKESGKDIPLIVVTGTLGDEAAVECIKQGAADYILKDRLHRLPVAVEGALRDKVQRQEAARLQEQIRHAKKEWEQTVDTVPDPYWFWTSSSASSAPIVPPLVSWAWNSPSLSASLATRWCMAGPNPSRSVFSSACG